MRRWPDSSTNAIFRSMPSADSEMTTLRNGMPLTRGIPFRGARNFVDQQLRRRVLRYVFGREAEMQDQLANDVVVSKAVDLLNRAQTQEELFAVAREEVPPAGR